jgi:glyoxylase-like metal-dependent hydrolase (beta-lactamase superfamily II)
MSETGVKGVADDVAVHRIEGSVDWPPGNVAAYLVDCAEPILIDAIMSGEDAHEELVAGLAEHGYDVDDIEHLVVTHPHVDHIGQVPAILEENDPTVYAPDGIDDRFERDPDELEETVRANARAAGLRGEYLDDAVEMSVESLERDSSLLPLDAVDHWVEGGETVDIGPVTMEAIHTPGHQADHLCFETDIDDETVLFSGDMALSTFRPVAMHTGFDDGYEDAIDAFYTGLDRLAERDVDHVYTGHDEPHRDFEAAIERDRESLDDLLAKTKAELDTEDGKTAVDVAFQRSGNRDIRYLVIETASAVRTLAADGEIEVTTEDGIHRYTRQE